MKEHPIIFSGPEVRAILEGRKTQTRRIIKWKPYSAGADLSATSLELGHYWTGHPERGWVLRSRGAGACWNDRTKPAYPKYAVGDLLWVREQLTRPDGDPWLYASDRQPVMVPREDETAMLVWAHHKMQDHCPSIHMPRWASRLTLEVVAARAERLQDITQADVIAEGVQIPVATDGCPPGKVAPLMPLSGAILPSEFSKTRWGKWPEADYYRFGFANAWDIINRKRAPWASNPAVWVYTFKRIGEAEHAE